MKEINLRRLILLPKDLRRLLMISELSWVTKVQKLIFWLSIFMFILLKYQIIISLLILRRFALVLFVLVMNCKKRFILFWLKILKRFNLIETLSGFIFNNFFWIAIWCQLKFFLFLFYNLKFYWFIFYFVNFLYLSWQISDIFSQLLNAWFKPIVNVKFRLFTILTLSQPTQSVWCFNVVNNFFIIFVWLLI